MSAAIRAIRPLWTIAIITFVLATAIGAMAQPFNREVGDNRIALTTDVRASPAEAFRAWTEPAEIGRFFAPQSRVELTPGGAYELLFLLDNPPGKRGCEGCKVLAYVPDELLVFSWNAPPSFAQARERYTWVAVRFDRADDRHTRVHLTHVGFGRGEEWDRVHAYFSSAWPRVLAGMKKRFE